MPIKFRVLAHDTGSGAVGAIVVHELRSADGTLLAAGDDIEVVWAAPCAVCRALITPEVPSRNALALLMATEAVDGKRALIRLRHLSQVQDPTLPGDAQPRLFVHEECVDAFAALSAAHPDPCVVCGADVRAPRPGVLLLDALARVRAARPDPRFWVPTPYLLGAGPAADEAAYTRARRVLVRFGRNTDEETIVAASVHADCADAAIAAAHAPSAPTSSPHEPSAHAGRGGGAARRSARVVYE